MHRPCWHKTCDSVRCRDLVTDLAQESGTNGGPGVLYEDRPIQLSGRVGKGRTDRVEAIEPQPFGGR
jgi:hypothetical protein